MGHKISATLLKEIKFYFSFLFKRGYEIKTVKELPMGDWEVTFVSTDNSIILVSDRGEFDVGISHINGIIDNIIGIRGFIYYLSKGEMFIGRYKNSLFHSRQMRFKELATLLQGNLDQINLYFGIDYKKYVDEITFASKQYTELFIKIFTERRK